MRGNQILLMNNRVCILCEVAFFFNKSKSFIILRLKPTKLQDVKESEMVIRYEDKRNDKQDYASNIQKMYNRVQKYKQQRERIHDAMGIKSAEPKIKNSKFSGVDRICGAVILERYHSWDTD